MFESPDILAQADVVAQAAADMNQAVPWLLDGLAVFVGLWGLILWLAGCRIVRPSLTLIGLIAGAIAGGTFGQSVTNQSMTIVAIIAGGIVGGAVVWLTYRLWLAGLLAVILAAAAPAAVLAWQGVEIPAPTHLKNAIKDNVNDLADTPGRFSADPAGDVDAGDADPTDPDRAADDAADPTDRREREAADDDDRRTIFDFPNDPTSRQRRPARQPDAADPAGPSPGAADDERSDPALEQAWERLREAVAATWQDLRGWWDGLGGGLKGILWTASIVVGLTGLLIGLIMPNLGSAIMTGLIGSGLLLAAVLRLSWRHAPDLAAFLPVESRPIVITLAAMTFLGAVLQWTILRRRADK